MASTQERRPGVPSGTGVTRAAGQPRAPTMRLRLHEPAVALTDLAIGVEAGICAIALARARSGDAKRASREVSLRRWFVVFFGATALAAIVAAAIQVRHIAVHPRLFDHNASYHATQAVAVACFYAAARRFVGIGQDTEFVADKERWDPDERFSSDWYRHYRDALRD